MPFERINMGGPELAKRSEPGVDLLKRLRPEAVKAALCIDRRLNKARLAKHSQVL